MIDPANIAVGDDITVRGRVYHISPNGDVGVRFRDGASRCLMIPIGEIATHTPTPREFTRGDLVTWGLGGCDYEFVARYGDFAFVGRNANDVRHLPYSELRPAKENAK